ncbi:MAG: molybdenum cofactor guanylyltransferase MobA [Pseudomonadota bacterium]
MKQPVGVILAGGAARRMGGGDKSLLLLGGQPMLTHALDRLAPQVAAVALSANGDRTRFNAFGLPVLPDPVGGYLGPLAGVLAGLEWAAAQGADTLVSVAADTPFFPCDLVPQLLLAAEGMTPPLVLAGTQTAGTTARHPTFGLWPVALRTALRRALDTGTRKVTDWADAQGARTAVFPQEAAFFNVNTPEDLTRAQALL